MRRAEPHTITQRQPALPLTRPLTTAIDIPPSIYSPSISSTVTLTPSTPRPRTPVPYVKLIPLLIQRWSEGLTYAVIFPYINEMVHSMGVEEQSVGVWSAVAESVMMVTESVSAPLYAPLANRFGRRPVLIVLEVMWGLFGMAFGLSKTVSAVIMARGCLEVGLLAGCGVISRTMCGEMCDKSNRIQGFAVFSPAFTIGMTTAPLIGGFLARPVPRLLPSTWTLFANFPYLLPALATGASAVIAAGLSVALLPETLPKEKHVSKRRKQEAGGGEGSLRELISSKKFQMVLALYGLHNAIMFSYEAVFPLFGFTSRELGGLGISTQTLGVILGFSAALSIVMTIFVFPSVHSSMLEHQCLLMCLACYPLATIFFPIMWSLGYAHTGEGLPGSVWVTLALHMILRRTGDFAATQLDTLVLDAIPGPEHLASANSITFSMAAICRSIGPFLVSIFFAHSTTYESPFSPGRQLVWVVLVLLAVPSMLLAYKLGDEIGGKDKEEDEERHELLDERGKVEYES
ncbi:hypothetical protein IAT38_002979 [Cryptococcus sp. DSM 104549]